MQINIISHTTQPSESVQRLNDALKIDSKVFTIHYGCGVDKLTQYSFFKEKDLPHPEWTEEFSVAAKWLKSGNTVLCRKLTNGHKGHGIEVVEPGDSLPVQAKIYTKLLKKKREFRVNCFQGKVVNIREKKLQKGFEPSLIRSIENGYTTTYPSPMSENLISRVKTLAEQASLVSESDFTGVDIGYNEFYDKVFVLEVNSGPSIEGSSVDDFIKVIQEAASKNVSA